MKKREIFLSPENRVDFHNQVDFCVGTGRMGLALHKEYQEQLRLVQEEIGFRHIRGHGLFCDDMAIFQTGDDGQAEYNYTYLDRVMDSYLEMGLRPFLELGFMPEKMASGTQTLFYWKANTTPPASYEAWTDMVKAVLLHLCERYGREEVIAWPVEVWNEPNLPGFWENADMQEYFKLFHRTFLAVKELDPRFQVGGPAVCGGSDELWIRAFLEYCRDSGIRPDFITRHHYTTEVPERVGHYGYPELTRAEDGFANLHTTREIIDSFPEFRGMKIHLTEFNTSYIPNAPLHDTNQNAAYIARQLSRLGEENESYSYWTFGDVFEEQGVPFTPFHGGFGLVASGCVPKPTFWTFAFFKKLKEGNGHCVWRSDSEVVMYMEDGSYRGVIWNTAHRRTGQAELVTFQIRDSQEGCLLTRTVDESHCNPLKVWHDMGEPSSLSREQVHLLRDSARPFVKTRRTTPRNGKLELSIPVEEHGVVYFQWTPGRVKPDRGYSYGRAMQYPAINPVTRLDYPDPDVIRVGDTYYMVSTTMHFMPGCEILRSYDLRNWEHLSYVYEKLDSTPARRLEGEDNIYGKGMWAASLRWHEGVYYICFAANDTHQTYLYTATDPKGPWEQHIMDGFFHDCSLFFDDDGKRYIVYGNRKIWLARLKDDLSGLLEGGLCRLIADDRDNPYLGYEGSHLYKIGGKYCLFLIHSRPDRWRRTEACLTADSLEGEFTGGDVLDDDYGLPDRGIAQGPVVDTPDGKWYALQFQDIGAAGRIPFLLPVTWKDGYPIFGDGGTVPEEFSVKSTRPGYVYYPLVGSDDFRGELRSSWQFNHEPDLSLVCHDRSAGTWQVTTDKICSSLLQARNTLTQRMLWPGCAAQVTIDGSGLREGDFAGLCALQACFGFVGLTRREGRLYLTVRTVEPKTARGTTTEKEPEREWLALPVEEKPCTLKLEADFSEGRDVCSFYYREKNFSDQWRKLGGEHRLRFDLEHFCGCRFGLTVYSTEKAGGSATFSEFIYRER